MSHSNMSEPFVSIIMRSFNEGWALRETLPALAAQDYKNWELIVIDSGSTDGSVELIRKARPRLFVQIQPHEYNPARVMNHGMQVARSEFGIFINADATPQGTGWLRPLVLALQDRQVAAVFGKQIPRPDCRAVFAHDYDRCFGERRESLQWDHFFSMVSSGLRKDIWARRGFLEQMQYSEDDEYTRWCRAEGYRIVYVPESVVMHSHNYTRQQAYKRSFGEAKALAAVWTGSPSKINWPRTVWCGWLNDARRDLGFCLQSSRISEWPHAAIIRWEQRRAKLAGFREGWKFYRTTASDGSRPGPAGAVPKTPPRFTIDGSDGLERSLEQTCSKVLDGVLELIPAGILDALVLGGGYGRGQGGVLKTAAGDRPYNDLEFYVFLRGNRIWNEHRHRASLERLGESLTRNAGLHVEFKIDSLTRLRRSGVTMFSYDLLSGHRVLWSRHGPDTVFAGCEAHLNAADIPVAEATRLLFNRCTGLLLAKEMLRRGTLDNDQADFVGRNIAKARLAFGDSVLVACRLYHWNCCERHRRLKELLAGEPGRPGMVPPNMAEIIAHHAAGLEFKLHPVRTSDTAARLAATHRAVSDFASKIWIWVESVRLKRSFPSVRDYAMSAIEKCNGVSALRNVLLNARTFGPRTVLDGTANRYPRERLLNSLPLLLWDEPLNDLRVRQHLQNQLHTTASDWQSLVAAYKAVWPRFS